MLDDGRILDGIPISKCAGPEDIEIPAGKLDDPDEKGILCAARELEEETGYKSEQLEWSIIYEQPLRSANEKIEIYVAKTGRRVHRIWTKMNMKCKKHTRWMN